MARAQGFERSAMEVATQARFIPSWPALSLRARLAVLAALVVGTVVAVEGYLESRMFVRDVENARLDTAIGAARAIADDLELREDAADKFVIDALLHDFIGVTPGLRELAVAQEQGRDLEVIARTGSGRAADVLPTARLANARGAATWTRIGDDRLVAVPLTRPDHKPGAVIATVSFAPLAQLQERSRMVTLWFAIPAIAVITLGVDLLARRLVHQPIAHIQETMNEAGSGDYSARALIEREDEIGSVASGLNVMLGRMQQLHVELQSRVDVATAELRETNTQLIQTHQRLLALRQELSRAEQLAAVGQTAAIVAHQIGTPLNLISGHVQLLTDELRSDRRAVRRLRAISAQIQKVTGAVRALLDNVSQPAVHLQSTDLQAVLDQVCEMARPTLGAAHIALHVETDSNLPLCLADPQQLEVALLNLLSNSLDAMPEGGRLDVRLSRIPFGAKLEITDTGSGVPPEVLERMFEPWVTTKPPGRGTGLGLSITRKIVEATGGHIRARSEPGQGTVFAIELPEMPSSHG